MEQKQTIINGHEAVDLGLSVKWATCNVGAESPEDFGGYYAWGETEPKSEYTEATYKYYKWYEYTGYCYDDHYVLDPEDDVACVKWGDGWRMPTCDEIEELRNKCTWQWTTVNGVKGYLATGPNGNSIFLPAAGIRYGTDVGGRGSRGDYWSATLDSGDYGCAWCLVFLSGGYRKDKFVGRVDGRSVRPVTE